jgi:hypothetical protein
MATAWQAYEESAADPAIVSSHTCQPRNTPDALD